MHAISAIYEGGKIFPLEEMPAEGKFKVIITFIEELDDEEDVRNLTAQMDAFAFWESEEEDIYQDFLVENAV